MLYRHITGYEVHACQYDGNDIGQLIEECRLKELDGVDITITSDLLIVNNMYVVKGSWLVRDNKAILVLSDKNFNAQFTKV